MRDPVTATAGEARAALARANLTQLAVAERTGRSPAYWSRRFSGEVPFDIADLAAIADLTGVPISTLVSAA